MERKMLKRVALVCIILCLFFSTYSLGYAQKNTTQIKDTRISYVPPNPEVYSDFEEKDTSRDSMETGKVPVISQHSVQQYANSQLIPTAGSVEEIIMIPITFTNKDFKPEYNNQYFEELGNELKEYYEFNSNYVSGISGMSVRCTITDVVNSTHTMEFYGEDQSSIDDANVDISELAREAVQLLEAEGFDFTPFDKNGDNIIDHVFVIHAGQGQEEAINTDLIWSHYSKIEGGEEVDGKTVSNYIMVPETSRLGVFAHEFGHDLGLPDLYDTNGFEYGYTFGVGAWGIMGNGSWNHLLGEPAGTSPSNLSAWSRAFLGWTNPIDITRNIDNTIIDNDNGLSTVMRVWPEGDILSDEYYLVEYRRKAGFDEGLPGEGVLIWHIDQEFVDMASDINLVNAFEARLGIELEQADGNWDLWYLRNIGDDTDPFAGFSLNNNFMSIPYGLNYSNIEPGKHTYVDILDISTTNNSASASIYVEKSHPTQIAELMKPENGVNTYSQPVFEWSNVPQTESYVLQISENIEFTQNVVEFLLNGYNDELKYSGNYFSYMLPLEYELDIGKDYFWRVAAINSSTSDNEVWSITNSFSASLHPDIITFDFTPEDVIEHPNEPILYLSDKQGKKVYSVNYESMAMSSISFDLPPERMTFYDDKLYVCLLKGEHSSYWWEEDQEGAFAVIDTSTFSLENIYDINIDPYDIAIDRIGNIYISSGSAQWTSINSYSSSTKQEVDSTRIRQQSFIEFHPILERIYTIDTDSTPRDIRAYNVNNNGAFLDDYDSSYHGDYLMDTNFEISPDGKYIVNGAGTIFTCSLEKEKDILYFSTLGVSFQDITFNLEDSEIYLVLNDGRIAIYDYTTLSHIETFSTKNNVSRVYYRNEEFITIENDDNNVFCLRVFKRQPAAPSISFSFDGDYAGQLIGATIDMEYSLDGGMNYKPILRDNMRLTTTEISSITAENDILIRVKATSTCNSGNDKLINILQGPTVPDLVWNDEINMIYGLDETLEYTTNYFEWIKYNNLIPDISGDIRIYIRKSATGLTLPGSTYSIKFSSQEVGGNEFSMNFEPMDTVIHPELPITYITSKECKKLFAINYETKEVSLLSFDWIPESMTFYEDKLYVGLLKGEHSSYWWKEDQEGAFAVIDTSTFSLENIYDINIDPYDIAIDRMGNIYISSGSAQWTTINSYSASTKVAVDSTGIRQQSFIEFHPILERIYTINTDTSPRDLRVYNVNNNGVFLGGDDSPYHGDYSMDTNFKISPDGKYIFNGAGTIFTCSLEKEKDMIYFSTLDVSFEDITFNLEDSEIYLALNNGKIAIYDYTTLSHIKTFSTKNNVSRLYYRNEDFITLENDDNNVFYLRVFKSSAPSISFSFNGDYAGQLMGTTIDMEYSLDAGLSYSGITSNDMKLNNDELETITSNNDIRVRLKGASTILSGADCILDVLSGPGIPNVSGNDSQNSVSGIDTTMEFSTDNGETWTKYNDNLPDLSGNITLNIRKNATGLTLAGTSVSLVFTIPALPPPQGGGFPMVLPPPLLLEPEQSGITVESISEQLDDSESSEVVVNIQTDQKENSINIELDVFNKLEKAKKNIKLEGNKVDILLPATAFDNQRFSGENAQVKLVIEEINKEDVSDKIKQSLVDDGKRLFSIGNTVFEFSAAIVSDEKTTAVTEFDSSITITITLTTEEMRNVNVDKLGVYYYNETKKDWEYVGGVFNEETGTITFTTEHFSYYTVMQYNKTFDDIKDHWAKEYIEKMASMHITNGKTDNLFDPNSNTTKSEFVALVVRALDLKKNDKKDLPFDDVDIDKWYYSEIDTAYSQGIITSSVSFNPEVDITREEMMVIIVEALKNSGNYEKLEDNEVEIILSQFNDSGKIAHAYKEAVALAIKNGIINGRTNNILAPNETATRAETMVVVLRLLDIIHQQFLK